MEYDCLFMINPNIEKREFDEIEKKATSLFLNFINKKDYGKGINSFWFSIYVEKEVNLGRHRDTTYDGDINLTAHINYDSFIKSDTDNRIKLLLNAAFILIKYLKDKLIIPKDVNINDLYGDYNTYLESKNLKLPKKIIDVSIIKPFDTMKFDFVVTQAREVRNNKIHYNLNDIQDYINNQLSGKTFGNSIKEFKLGYEIFDFNGEFKDILKETKNYSSYRTKYKFLLVVKQFDYGEIKEMNKEQQFKILQDALLEAIKDIELMKRRPKDFNNQLFYKEMEKILDNYNKYKLM